MQRVVTPRCIRDSYLANPIHRPPSMFERCETFNAGPPGIEHPVTDERSSGVEDTDARPLHTKDRKFNSSRRPVVVNLLPYWKTGGWTGRTDLVSSRLALLLKVYGCFGYLPRINRVLTLRGVQKWFGEGEQCIPHSRGLQNGRGWPEKLSAESGHVTRAISFTLCWSLFGCLASSRRFRRGDIWYQKEGCPRMWQ